MARSRSLNSNVNSNDSDWFRKDDDVRWQWSEATWTTNGSPKGEHDQAHQFASPKRGNANFAWVQYFIHHLAPHGMASFGLARFLFLVKLKAARVFKRSGNRTPNSFRERRRVFIEPDLVDCIVGVARTI
jgi:type I restriction enzyme M protein